LVTGITRIDYAPAKSVAERLAEYWMFGPFALSEDEPQGIVAASCRFVPRAGSVGLRSMEFAILGISDPGMERRAALTQGMERAGDALIVELFRSNRIDLTWPDVWVE
jgi:hypothetical protein